MRGQARLGRLNKSPVGIVLAATSAILSLVLLWYFARAVINSLQYQRKANASEVAARAVNAMLLEAARSGRDPSLPVISGDVLQLYPGGAVLLIENDGAIAAVEGTCSLLGRSFDPRDLKQLDLPFAHPTRVQLPTPCREGPAYLSGAPLIFNGRHQYLLLFDPLPEAWISISRLIRYHAVPWLLPALLLPTVLTTILLISWRRFRSDVRELSQIAQAFAAGDLTQRSRPRLFKELDTVASVFNEMAADVRGRLRFLETDDEQRKQMLHSLIHDLRTPFASMRSAVLLLKEHTNEPGRVSRYRAVVEASLSSLDRLGGSLEVLAREHAAEAAFHAVQFDVEELIDQLALELSPAAEAKGVSIVTVKAHVVKDAVADRTLVYRAITNLLANALRFAPQGTAVELESGGDSEQLVFSVRDKGRGIPAEELGTVFRSFVRLNQPENRSSRGAGLGLAFVKRVAELHGGDARAQSSAGAGTELVLSIPARARTRILVPELERSDAAVAALEPRQRSETLNPYVLSLECVAGVALALSASEIAGRLFGWIVLVTSGLQLVQTRLPRLLRRSTEQSIYIDLLFFLAALVIAFSDAHWASTFSYGFIAATKAFLVLTTLPPFHVRLLIAVAGTVLSVWRKSGLLHLGALAGIGVCITPTLLDKTAVARRLGFRTGGLIFIAYQLGWLCQIIVCYFAADSLIKADGAKQIRDLLASDLIQELALETPAGELETRMVDLERLNPQLKVHAILSTGEFINSHALEPDKMRWIADMTRGPQAAGDFAVPYSYRKHLGMGSLHYRSICSSTECSQWRTFLIAAPSAPASLTHRRLMQREVAKAAVAALVSSLVVLLCGIAVINTLLGRPFSIIVEAMRAYREGRLKDVSRIRNLREFEEIGSALRVLVGNLDELNAAISRRAEDRKRFARTLSEVLLDSVRVLSDEMQDVLTADRSVRTESTSFTAGVEQMMRREKLMEVLLLMFSAEAGRRDVPPVAVSLNDLLFESSDGVVSALPRARISTRYADVEVEFYGDLELLLDTLQLLLREAAAQGYHVALSAEESAGHGLLQIDLLPEFDHRPPTRTEAERLYFLVEVMESCIRLQGGSFTHTTADFMHRLSFALPAPPEKVISQEAWRA